MPAGRPTAAARVARQGDQTVRDVLGVAKLAGEPLRISGRGSGGGKDWWLPHSVNATCSKPPSVVALVPPMCTSIWCAASRSASR